MDQQNFQPQQQPPIYQPPVQPQSNAKSIVALVCGILGIIGSFIPVICYFTLVLAILGIVFGALGMKQAKFTNTGKGLAVAGLVLGIVGASFGVVGVICICTAAAAVASLGSLY